jgi:hypothetical protein
MFPPYSLYEVFVIAGFNKGRQRIGRFSLKRKGADSFVISLPFVKICEF